MADTSANIGIVLCDCGGTLRDRLDFEKLQTRLSKLNPVKGVKICSDLCRKGALKAAVASLSKAETDGSEAHTDRVVIAACDREIFDSNLREAISDGELNQGLLWCVNIREHCGWVHPEKSGTDKAVDILTTAVRRLELAETITSKKTEVTPHVLVIGGGVAAIQTASGLVRLGHEVVLVNKDESLGGAVAQAPQLYAYVTSDSSDAEALVKSNLNRLVEHVEREEKINILNGSTLKSLEGEFGNFTAVVDTGDGEQEITAGAVVLTADAGLSPLEKELAGLVVGQKGLVVGQKGLVVGQKGLVVGQTNGFKDQQNRPKRVAIVMDILGEQKKAISAQALSAAELLAGRCGAEVKLYCHNIRVAATGLENLYRRARKAGVVVMKYESPPTISEEGAKRVVRVVDPVIDGEVTEDFDLVLQADSPYENGKSELADLIEGLHTGPQGSLQADNVWLFPTKSNRDGIFVVGSTVGRDELRDVQAEGLATASEIHQLLKDTQIEVFENEPVVDSEKCVLCLTCMRVCPHSAVRIDLEEEAASMSAVVCKHCGICAAMCPAGAIQLPGYTDEQIAVEIGDKPQITVFACENSALPAATDVARNGFEYDVKVRLIRVPCAGKVDSGDVLRALEAGAERVMILGCHQENCQYLNGSTRALKMVERLNDKLQRAGVETKRVILRELASVESSKFLEYVKEWSHDSSRAKAD